MSNSGRQASVQVGLFVLVALGILIAGSLWVAGSPMFGGPQVPYVVRIQNSAGVKPGDRVRYAGVQVGRIKSIELKPGDPLPVVFRIQIRPDVPVTEGCLAKISTTGLLGTPFLQILAGNPEAPRLPPGSEINGRATMGLEEALSRIDEISGRAVGVMDKTGRLLDQVSAELGPIMANVERLLSEDNARDVREILATLRGTLNDAGPRLTSLLDNLEASSRKLDGAMDDVPEVTERVSGLVQDIRSALGQDGQRLAGVLDTAQGALASAEDALSVVSDERVELESMMRDLRDTIANLKDFSQQVKERPFSLVRIRNKPDRQPGEGVKASAP